MEGLAYIVIGFFESRPRYQLPLFALSLALKGVFVFCATIIATIRVNNQRQIYPYKLCEIRDRGGDLGKRWYVEFYVYDIATHKLVRKQDYSINTHKTSKARMMAAMKIKQVVDARLQSGGHIDSAAVADVPQKKSLPVIRNIKEAVQWVQLQKKSITSDRTKQAYNSYVNVISEWSDIHGMQKTPLHRIATDHLHAFLDWLVQERKVSNTTRNNYLIHIKSTFNFLVERKILLESPAKGIKPLKEKISREHVPYSDKQASEIKCWCQEKDRALLLVIALEYYCFLRPAEIRLLQVKNFVRNKLYVPAEILHEGQKYRVSKNGKSGYVVIPQPLQAMIEQQNILNHPDDFFIFSKNLAPGPDPVGINYIRNRYQRVLAELKISGGQTLYSWKHTGVIKLYQAIKDPKKIMEQCRHHSMEVTLIYLRDLGLFENEELENNFPSF
jgi:integrase